ncbi:CPBP family intramembrane metalloprotease [Pseudoduganella sp. FT26W]|uniref:CPBP family intramembrane metalloprotease n=1 Tax=Duganella aquatilis TaxID=2666082 RepID=A0A844D1E2_9BURK|nr:CPBP family intramembrane glutamic endopeptidase [Duganella aquatilis]MRW86613.1 CPBP family intramembrane metalloprotease [Duganella aquatilis]
MTLQFPAFLLLALALASVWAPSLSIGRRPAPLWLLFFVMAMAWGLVGGVLDPVAISALLVLTGAAWGSSAAPRGWLRLAYGVLAVVLALALAMHKLPGFNNPMLLDHVVLSAGALPFTLYANFDKGAVGLILLALLCRRVTSWSELGAVLRRTLPILALTVAATLGFALAAGVVGIDVKLPRPTPTFVAVNLLFTVIAEEAFFRGLLQACLADALNRFRWGPWLAMAVSALLFGAVHLGGGLRYGILAAIAGLGYAWAYQRTQRIEAAILVHITLNVVHFICFTYPARIDGV